VDGEHGNSPSRLVIADLVAAGDGIGDLGGPWEGIKAGNKSGLPKILPGQY
jgi:hypothetical protein